MYSAPLSKFIPQSPKVIFIIIALAVFVSEALVMLLFSYLPPFSVGAGAFLDSALLLVLISPTLYYFLFRPMVNYLNELHDIQNTLLKNEEEQFKVMVHTSLDGFMITDLQGRFLEVNDAYCKLLGYSREELLQMSISDVEAQETPEEIEKHTQKLLKKGSDYFQTRQRHKDGHLLDFEGSANYSKLFGGRIYSFLRDISERKDNEKRIYDLAHFDSLTTLPNRTLFKDRLHQALNTAKREKSRLALMFLDLDRFKPVNDTYGHDVGDQVLQAVAGRLRECVRESDTISRTGGDEFIILLPNIDAAQDALLVANKILHGVSLPLELNGIQVQLTASIGIAIYPEHGSNEKTLSKNADDAMYCVKESGRNGVKLCQTNPDNS